MKILIIAFLLVLSDDSWNRIAFENKAKKDAEEAYAKGDYKDAINKFGYLIDSIKSSDEKAVLNLAHCYFKTGDMASAAKVYERAYNLSDKKVKSVAAQQLGVISFKGDNDKPKAINYFKESLKADPTNKDARYNYEFLKKLIEAKQDPKSNQDKKDDNGDKKDDKKEGGQDKQDQNKDGKGDDKKDQKGDKKDGKDGKDGKKDENKNGKDGKENKEGDKGDKKEGDKSKDDKKGSDKDGKGDDKNEQAKGDKDKKDGKDESTGLGKDDKKDGKEDENGAAQKEKQGGKKEKQVMVANPEALAKMGMNEARAKMLLDAMKSGEVQYLQQMKREPAAKTKSKKKPDW
ncbi:MAG: hypothetical protein SFY32_08515 [Bacteroidota bacterium]|nr:hypothetical protein [Bacteroidota bacterium]